MKLINLFAGCMAILFTTSCGENHCNSNVTEIDSANIVIENIMARRSIRKYKDTPVEREKLEKIVECGINAPSGLNKQPWVIRIVTDTAFINATTEIFKKENAEHVAADPNFKNMYRNATALICIASPIDGSGQFDCGLLAENMMLAAHALKLGTCCLGGPIQFLRDNEDAKPYLNSLEIPSDYRLLYIIGVGYPDESPVAKSRDESKVKFL